MAKILKVGFDQSLLGTLSIRDGKIHADGPQVDQVKQLVEAAGTYLVQDNPNNPDAITAQGILDRMAQTMQGRCHAVWVEEDKNGTGGQVDDDGMESVEKARVQHKDGETWESNGRHYKREGGVTVRIPAPNAKPAPKESPKPTPKIEQPKPSALPSKKDIASSAKAEADTADKPIAKLPAPLAKPPAPINWQHKDALHPVAQAIASDANANAAVRMMEPHAEFAQKFAELTKRERYLYAKFNKAKGTAAEKEAGRQAWSEVRQQWRAQEGQAKANNDAARGKLFAYLKIGDGVKINAESTARRSWWNPLGSKIRSKEEIEKANRGGKYEKLMAKSVANNEKAMSYATNLLGAVMESHGKSIDVEVGYSSSGRAFQLPVGPLGMLNRKPIIGMGIKTDPQDAEDTAIHELGHQLEDSIPDISRRVAEFIKYRIGDEKPVDLATVPGGEDMKGEMGRKDNFDRAFDSVSAHYVGKVYPGGGTEVVSMGLEKLHRDPVGFLAGDPEYAGFIVSLLRRSKP